MKRMGAACLAMLLSATVAQASIIEYGTGESLSADYIQRYDISGVIWPLDEYGILNKEGPGTPFTGYFELKTLGLKPNIGMWDPLFYTGWFGIDFADRHFSGEPTMGYQAQVIDGDSMGGDALELVCPPSGIFQWNCSVTLEFGGSASMFTVLPDVEVDGYPVPQMAFDPSAISGGSILVSFPDGGMYSGTVSTVTPEPSTIAMLSLLAVGCFGGRARG
ncbi:MAG: PEP-CTERM sorting domain-containing protein [Phycisphaeraceae bacterium]|nr:PEP-CTERM sorting domain-containing protein [Phycisphaeraceae bacterium]